MVQADFDFNANFDTGVINGGNDGYATTNASLSDPLTGEGTYCREFTNTTSGDIAMSATVSASVNAGEFFEIPSTKSISVRAWLRHTNVGAGTYAIGIGAKIHAGAPDTDTNAPNGYTILLGDVNQTGANNQVKFVADNGVSIFNANTGFVVSNDIWYKLRLDIIPVGTAEDHIFVYSGTGTTGSETWNLEYSTIILNSDMYYIPWAETGNGKVGFWTMHTGSAESMFIDRFQIFLEDV